MAQSMNLTNALNKQQLKLGLSNCLPAAALCFIFFNYIITVLYRVICEE